MDKHQTAETSRKSGPAKTRAATALEHVVAVFGRYVKSQYDSDLSLCVLDELFAAELITDSLKPSLTSFAEAKDEKLRAVFVDRTPSWNRLFLQPEAIVLFMLLEKQPELLCARKPEALGDDAFEDLAAAWGVVA